MPLDPGSISVIMQSNLSAVSFFGIAAPQLALGVANGLSLYAPTGIRVISVDAGVLGAGTGIGSGVILPTPVLITSLTSTFAANGIIGISAPILVNALSIGFTQAFTSAIVNTINPTVGVGSGVITLIPNTAASALAFVSGFTAAGLVGIASASLANAIASGLDGALSSAKGFIVIAGSPSQVSSTGVGTGKLS